VAKLISTLIGVLAAVGAFTALWVGANLLFSQATKNFTRFAGLSGALVGGLVFTLLDGNRLLTGLVNRPATLLNGDEPGLFTDGIANSIAGHLFWPAVGAVIGAAMGVLLATVGDRTPRLAASAGALAVVGAVVSFLLKTRYELAMRTVPLITWTVVLLAVGAAISLARGRGWQKGALTGAAIGWLAGSFGAGFQGISVSNQLETTVALMVFGLLVGARLGMTSIPDVSGRANIDDKGRAFLFVGPGVALIAVMLIIPAFQTFFLSLRDRDAIEFVGLDNYRTVFDDDKNLDTTNAGLLFSSEVSDSIFPWGGSALIPWAAFFLVVGIALALLLGRETGQRFNFSGSPIGSLLLSAGIFSFALFTHLRGTIMNNLWWVIGVTLLSTSLGLAIAKLADGAKFEAVAKSFVFMPMAISFVGASIIWRLMMYQARNVSKNQTGVFNAIWVWLGQNTTDWGVGKVLIGGIFIAAALALAVSAIRTLSSSPSVAGLYAALTIIPLWVGLRAWGDGIGGFTFNDAGDFRSETVNFVQDGPYNNFFLMVILIWIQTGFAMVILSAAIKAVPEDFIEAAKIDGATDGQIFWRITVPSIAPTIGVVSTATMVNVMKVFDIVKVTTNGQFGSQVLANAMWTEAFLFFNRGLGAALAILIFIGVFPVMVFNIYRLTREEA
jgi:alpha-glucoside transport system permease protein